MHFYHRLGGLNLRCTAGKLGPGIDTRANGGYVILPPSRPDPKRPPYAFVNGSDFFAAPVVPPELVQAPARGTSSRSRRRSSRRSARGCLRAAGPAQ